MLCRCQRQIYSMVLVVTFTTQINISNQAQNDFHPVLLFEIECHPLCIVKFISPNIITILAMMTLQHMHPCMPLSVQSLWEVVAIQPFLCDMTCLPRLKEFFPPFNTTEIMLFLSWLMCRSIRRKRTSHPDWCSQRGIINVSEYVDVLFCPSR